MYFYSMKILIPAIFIFIINLTNLYSQDKGFMATRQMEARYHYGFIFPHNNKIEYLVEDHVSAFDISLVKPRISDNVYDQLFHYPRTGIGFYHSNMQNKDVLGTVNSLFGSMNAPVYRFSDKFQVDYQIVAGLAYLSKKFDLEDNNLNIAISTHLNLHFSAQLDYRLRIKKYYQWTGGIAFSHYSSGRIELPNLGFNYISVFTGLSYNFNREPAVYPSRNIPEFKRQFEQSVVLAFGLKQDYIIDHNYYLINTLSYDFGRRIQQHIKLSAGLDLFYDESIKTFYINAGIPDYHMYELYRLGGHGGFHLTYRKLTMITMVGTYIYTSHRAISPVYSRFGLQYKVSDHFFLNVSLKAHNAVADFVEWGFGYSF